MTVCRQQNNILQGKRLQRRITSWTTSNYWSCTAWPWSTNTPLNEAHPAKEPSLFGDDPVSSAAHVDMHAWNWPVQNEYICCSLSSSIFIVSPSVMSLRILSTGLPHEARRMFAHVDSSAMVAMSLIVSNSSVCGARMQSMFLLPFLPYVHSQPHAWKRNSRYSGLVVMVTRPAHGAESGAWVSVQILQERFI